MIKEPTRVAKCRKKHQGEGKIEEKTSYYDSNCSEGHPRKPAGPPTERTTKKKQNKEGARYSGPRFAKITDPVRPERAGQTQSGFCGGVKEICPKKKYLGGVKPRDQEAESGVMILAYEVSGSPTHQRAQQKLLKQAICRNRKEENNNTRMIEKNSFCKVRKENERRERRQEPAHYGGFDNIKKNFRRSIHGSKNAYEMVIHSSQRGA